MRQYAMTDHLSFSPQLTKKKKRMANLVERKNQSIRSNMLSNNHISNKTTQ